LLGEMRQQKLMELLVRERSVRIADLKDMFNVSEETIRRDLRKLEADGLVKRTHGGAILTDSVHVVPPIQQRKQQHLSEKAAIAEKAVELIRDSSAVMLDSGSTTMEIARRLANRPVTVLTNDLAIAAELMSSLQVQLIVLGGSHQRGTTSLAGPECEEMIRRYHVDMVFLGTGGIGARQGLTTSSSTERLIKRAMMESGDTVYCVADSSKFGRAALVSYARPDEIDGIITNSEVEHRWVDELRRQGAEVIFA
jgi:DeoR/GlpR family transcriptional regulator of sugar metabolism